MRFEFFIRTMRRALQPGISMNVMKLYNPDTDDGPVPSPCIGVCSMLAQTGLCEGCFRTLDEIAIWRNASEDCKRLVWQEIRQRQIPNA